MAKTIPSLLTVSEAQKLLAERIKTRRLSAGFKRTTLAERSGVSLGSLKRFEETCEISLKNLLRLAMALGCLEEIKNLFELYENMLDVLLEQNIITEEETSTRLFKEKKHD